MALSKTLVSDKVLRHITESRREARPEWISSWRFSQISEIRAGNESNTFTMKVIFGKEEILEFEVTKNRGRESDRSYWLDGLKELLESTTTQEEKKQEEKKQEEKKQEEKRQEEKKQEEKKQNEKKLKNGSPLTSVIFQSNHSNPLLTSSTRNSMPPNVILSPSGRVRLRQPSSFLHQIRSDLEKKRNQLLVSGEAKLVEFIFEGNLEKIREFISDPEWKLLKHFGLNVLHLAAIAGPEVFRVFLENLPPEKAREMIGEPDAEGYYPILYIWAALSKFDHSTQTNLNKLIELQQKHRQELGLRWDIKNAKDGNCLLHYCVLAGIDTVFFSNLLLSESLSEEWEATNTNGETPLHIAIRTLNFDICLTFYTHRMIPSQDKKAYFKDSQEGLVLEGSVQQYAQAIYQHQKNRIHDSISCSFEKMNSLEPISHEDLLEKKIYDMLCAPTYKRRPSPFHPKTPREKPSHFFNTIRKAYFQIDIHEILAALNDPAAHLIAHNGAPDKDPDTFVYRVPWRGGEAVIKKFLNPGEEEFSVMKYVRSSHCVQLFGGAVDIKGDHTYLVMEYCQKHSINQILSQIYNKKDEPKDQKKKAPWNQKQKKTEFTERLLLQWLIQTAEALVDLHEQKPTPYVHKDLKTDNLLVDRWNNCKLGDFGSSHRIDSVQKTRLHKTTPRYTPPEIWDHGNFNERHYTYHSDIFSLGLIVWELINAKAFGVWQRPFPDIPSDYTCQVLAEKKELYPKNLTQLKQVGGLIGDLSDIVRETTNNQEPRDRPNARACLERFERLWDTYIEE